MRLAFRSFFVFALHSYNSLSPRGEGEGEGVMVLLLNMFKATSTATETVPVGYFLNHKFCSNDLAQQWL
jgi:hypothetical protein